MNLHLLKEYVKYWIKSRTKYDIHSPFIYDLLTKVIEDKRYFYAYNEIEELRDQMRISDLVIPFQEMGAGSKVMNQKQRALKDIVKYSSIKQKYGQLLFRLVNYIQPSYILELGTSTGISTAYLASARKAAKIFTIEGNDAIKEIAIKNFKKLNLHNIHSISGSFQNKLPEIISTIPSLDLVFIDGHHAKEPTLAYFEQCLPKLHNDSIVIFDDIYWSKDMTEAWESIKKHPNVQQTVDIFFLGIVFFRKEQNKQHFILKY